MKLISISSIFVKQRMATPCNWLILLVL